MAKSEKRKTERKAQRLREGCFGLMGGKVGESGPEVTGATVARGEPALAKGGPHYSQLGNSGQQAGVGWPLASCWPEVPNKLYNELREPFSYLNKPFNITLTQSLFIIPNLTMKIVNTLLASSIVALAASQEAPAMCMTSPISTLAAGEVAQASVWNPIGRSCQATLSFADDNFLPVHFDTRPNTCPGAQQMELTIPNEVPNGEAFLSWVCAGDVAALCSRVMLVDGQSDVARLALAQTASLVCEVLATTFATLTNFYRGSVLGTSQLCVRG
ncbi:hypothetical protein V498_06124 [Pseudogymnoascus sp. VKM F-4517 (FW-2822)]|nr:hypothetical protein V498_06124 [Pseudogymnoascus sp. VKM F-4517 (FW-2822)]